MPPVAARTIGGPGAGKTHRAMDILAMCLERVVSDPFQVGFVSFTRAARREASTRAAGRFGVSPRALEKDGWFRTLHSVAYRQLHVADGELITGSQADTAWLRDLFGDDKIKLASQDEDDDYFAVRSEQARPLQSLALWDIARNRLVPLETIHAAVKLIDDRTPSLDVCQAHVELYERGKKDDGRLDFCDLLMRFSGRRCTGDHRKPFEKCTPNGLVPILPVWIHDEAQDMSALTALVFERLTEQSQYVYLMGDAWQAIFSFAGSDGSIFSNWNVAKEEILPISHRCRSNILAHANRIMHRQESPRNFTAKDEGGDIVYTTLNQALAAIRADSDTLILARTNQYAQEIAATLDDLLLPWKPIKGMGGFLAPARAEGIAALVTLRRGGCINGDGFHRILELLPAKADGGDLFVRGTKSRFKDAGERANLTAVPLGLLDLAGATENFKQILAGDAIERLLKPAAARMYRAATLRGIDTIRSPSVTLGTAHSSKGLEADDVVVLDRIPYPTKKAIVEIEGREEERRVWYVAASRARKRLTIAQVSGTESSGEL